MHKRINDKFRDAGISIAFPQRDIHLSAAEPLDVRVHTDRPEAAKSPSNASYGEKGPQPQ